MTTRTNNTHYVERSLIEICRFDPACVAKAMLKKRQHIGSRCLLLNSYLERIRIMCRPSAGINITQRKKCNQDGTNGKRFTTNLETTATKPTH